MINRKLRKHRVSRAKQRKSGKPPAKKSFRDLMLTTIVTLSIGTIWGDLIIKRNVENYNTERAQFEAAPRLAAKKFDEIAGWYNNKIDQRRRAAQRLQEYIAKDKVFHFNDYYPEYFKTVNAWNSDRRKMQRLLKRYTNCASGGGHLPAFLAATFKDLKFRKIHNGYIHDTDAIGQEILKKATAEKAECPNYFFTKLNGEFSLHAKFRAIHKKLQAYQTDGFLQCKYRHRLNINYYLGSCFAKFQDDEKIAECAKRHSEMVKRGSYCQGGASDKEKYKFQGNEFGEVDLYWGLGNLYFKSFRKDYILNECRRRIKFWGSVMSWDCDAQVDKFLGNAKKPTPQSPAEAILSRFRLW